MNTGPHTWLAPSGASPEVLRELEDEVGSLPPEYLGCLRIGNGGEVELCVSPFTLCLDSAESALDFWRSGAYTKKGVFVFGGDGGGTLLALTLDTPGEWSVVSFDAIDPEGSTELVAPSFSALRALCEGS